MFKVPNKYRVKDGNYGSDDSIGNNGMFAFKLKVGKKHVKFAAIVSDGGDWEHVSISIPSAGRTPTWDEMCYIKDMFWGDEDCVIQYHPPKSEHVNYHPYCLHLWRPIGKDLPRPPSIFVGPK